MQLEANNSGKLHPLLKFNLVLLSGILLSIVLFYGKEILIPLSFAVLFAMVMNPVSNKLEAKGIKRVWSTIICVLIIIGIVLLLLAIVGTQVYNISKQIPEIQEKFDKNMNNLQMFIHDKFNVEPQKQIEIIKKQISSLGRTTFDFFQKISIGFLGLIGYFVMVLVTLFLFLLQKEKYKSFFSETFSKIEFGNGEKIVEEIVTVAHKYIKGILLSIVILFVFYSIGFLIIGLKNVILLAAIAASLIFIPYVGSSIGGFLALIMALVTEDTPNVALGVIVVMGIIQTIDNNFIEPSVIGGEVRLSAVTSIIVVFIGGILWGIAGVVLFLPITGIVKVIFEHTESLKRYGKLIGDEQSKPPSSQLKNFFKKIFKKQ